MKLKTLFAIIISFVLAGNMLYADIARDENGKPKHDNSVQRASRGTFDLQKNTVSNLEFWTTNYGMSFLDVSLGRGSGIWPRGSQNHYIFGGGIWFGAQKDRPGTDITRNYVTISYNPNSGRSWMVPGRINDGDLVDNELAKKYRVYFSTDFSTNDGQARDQNDGPNWPIWDANNHTDAQLTINRYFGWYIPETGDRNKTTYPKGPAFISGEDIFATFKDTDLSRYEGGIAQRRAEGYPLKLQFEKMIYSWGFGDYRDIVFMAYTITNYSSDTLMNCWMAPVMDVDIAHSSNLQGGAGNDRTKYYDKDPSLNLAYQWSDADRGERGQGFGYLGFTFLESPAVIVAYDTTWVYDADNKPVLDIFGNHVFELHEILTNESNYLRKDKPYYDLHEQLGLRTVRNWSIEYDPKEDDERYNFISSEDKDGDDGPGDKRFMMATGPFHMKPMDTVRVVVGIILASTSKGGDADGSDDDIPELIRKSEFAIEVYNKNFAAPRPPDRAVFTVNEGLNNATRITWDSTSEISRDILEAGMDFLGYRLYRARRVDLDTFNVNTISSTLEHTRGAGPFGWKQIAEWSIPLPFQKSVHRAGKDNNPHYPLIDSLRIIGPYTNSQGNIIDSMAIRVMRIPQGVNMYPQNDINTLLAMDPTFRQKVPAYAVPVIANIDTSFFSQPWGKYLHKLTEFKDKLYLTNTQTNELMEFPYMVYNPTQSSFLMDSVVAGVAYLNRALIKFNPLLYQRKSISIDETKFASLPEDGLIFLSINDELTQTVDTAYIMSTHRTAFVNNTLTHFIDVYVPYPKSLWMRDEIQVNVALQDLYSMIQNGEVTEITFPDFENMDATLYNVILPYMARITNGRTFYDEGDDNKDGVITYDEDPTKTEKIINNIPYYYKLLAYDEGDYMQPTPLKLNDGGPGLPNFAELYPAASRAEKRVGFEVIYVDPSIGGLYNFNFFALEPERAMQLFGGDTLELEFQPVWQEREIRFLGRPETEINRYGLYQRRMKLTNITKDMELFNAATYFEIQPGYLESLRGLFTENAFSYVLADSVVYDDVNDRYITFGTPMSNEIQERTGKFSTGDFKTPGFSYTFGMRKPAYGTLAFDFDFTIKQYGGDFRPDSSTIEFAKFANGGVTPTTNATTHIGIRSSPAGRDANVVLTTQPVGAEFYRKTYDGVSAALVHGSFNNGPGEYMVEFLPGGEDVFHLEWGADGQKENKRFRVPYLNMKINNQISYERPAPENGPNEVATVSYPGDMPHMFIDTLPPSVVYSGFQYPARYYPDPRNLTYHGISTNEYIGKYNIASYGWVNSRGATNVSLPRRFARPYNSPLSSKARTYIAQGKYYLTGISEDGKDTVDFSHALDISGVMFGLDYANRGGRFPNEQEWGRILSGYEYGPDFKAGDKIMLKTFGGALGYPMPGAKVRVVVSEPMEVGEKYTDKLLDQIQVVPNPYYVSHQGQRSPYDAKLYFTRLPKKCTIDIYTITGDLVISIDHDELYSSEKDKYALNIWDLLTKNGQRVASQTLAAVISTPDGAQTIKNFTVVVGGFRLLPD